jgi:putative Mg2+ transporter-C (MgtC) family protein
MKALIIAQTSYSLPPADWSNLLLRLCIAIVIGAIIGFERQLKRKPAGLRTHMLVSFGSALFVLVPIELGAAQQNFEAISRVIQGITAGIGFIGAGEIIRESHYGVRSTDVRGLTSAAAIWVCAALGIAAGCGLWQLGLIGAFLSLLILSLFKKFEGNR